MESGSRLLKFLLLAALLGSFAEAASAQTLIISGTVRDRTGAAVPGVEVEILRNGERVRLARTDASGQFEVGAPALRPATYALRLTAAGFAPMTIPVTLDDGPLRADPGSFQVEGTVVIRGQTAKPPPLPPPPPPPPPTDPGAAKLDPYVVPVFFATDRARRAEEPLDFTGDRNPSAQLHLGRIDVRIPRDHRMGAIERPTIWTLWRENPEQHLVIVGRRLLSYEDFYGDVSRVVGLSNEKQALVFIHGYNVAFEDAAFRSAQLSYDLGFEGATVLYSWPSVSRTIDYRIDERNNEWTITHLRWFLEDLRRKSGARVIHLIAHSMGNRALVGALSAMAPPRDTDARFSQVVLAAPDIDAGLFPDIAAALRRVAGRVTLYASSRDRALEAARKYDTFQRVGSTTPRLIVLPGVDTIDASAVDTSLLGHSYFGDSTTVMSDLYYVIKGLTAGARAVIQRRGEPPNVHWTFR
jgi:esterase/lipase superfamily enzyme